MTWRDSDKEECPTTTNLAVVSEEMESLVKEACTKRLPNSVDEEYTSTTSGGS